MSKDIVAENLKLSSSQDFKKEKDEREKGEAVELPSGKVVKLKKISLLQMIKNDIFPTDLVNLMMRFQNANSIGTGNNAVKSIQAIEIIVRACVLEPVISDTPNYDDGEISIDDLADDDKVFIFQWIQGGVKDAESFRKGQRGIENVGPDMPPISEPETE